MTRTDSQRRRRRRLASIAGMLTTATSITLFLAARGAGIVDLPSGASRVLNLFRGASPTMATHRNRLGEEKSPYLLQHKDNPVWWQPWGPEAFAAAKAQDKPIFLSVGYATCHWCHVMEHESFEDAEVAAQLNRDYVCIKVDREELPDVDQIYMNAVHAMGQRGGWPMSIVMTPDLKPFFGGTYFPKPQFMYVMKQLHDAWVNDRAHVHEVADNLLGHLKSMTDLRAGDVVLNEDLLRKAYKDNLDRFDPIDGGFGEAPKFPPSMQLRLLLRIHRRTGNAKALEMVETTLHRMAWGGIYDHLGGGFARYSTDGQWIVPHFEKMLYDNALLTQAYLEAYQVSQNPTWAAVARETLDYVLRDMTGPEGGFYSAEDADSEGEEGKFYVWNPAELERLLTPEERARVTDVYGVTALGNFVEHGRRSNGANILNLQRRFDWTVKQEPLLQSAHRKLFDARNKRIRPLRDDKQLTAWNGLMIASMAMGWQVLRDPRYLEAARNAARFIRDRLYVDGKLLRRYRDGEARYEGTLDDYAWLIQGLVTLYQSDFDQAWIDWALELQRRQDALFWDDAGGGYFYTPADAASLIVRTKDFTDNATPNANAYAALNLLELYHLTFDEGFKVRAERVLRAGGRVLAEYPSAFAQMLIALDFYTDNAREIAVVGEASRPQTAAMIEALHRAFLPSRVLAFADIARENTLKILDGKPIQRGETTVYVCEGSVCRYPTSDLAEVLKQLEVRNRYDL